MQWRHAVEESVVIESRSSTNNLRSPRYFHLDRFSDYFAIRRSLEFQHAAKRQRKDSG